MSLMLKSDCARNINTCALKGIVAELALNRFAEDETREYWGDLLDKASESGDEFYDYDGPATSF